MHSTRTGASRYFIKEIKKDNEVLKSRFYFVKCLRPLPALQADPDFMSSDPDCMSHILCSRISFSPLFCVSSVHTSGSRINSRSGRMTAPKSEEFGFHL